MARFTIKNNLPGQLYVPEPVGRFLKPGQLISVDIPAHLMDNAELDDMEFRELITISSANSPETDDDLEGPTFASVAFEHENYDTLAHDIIESNYEEVTYTNGEVTNITIWTDAGKTEKIRESQFTRDVQGTVTAVVEIQYADGVENQRLAETFAYNPDGSLASITTVRT